MTFQLPAWPVKGALLNGGLKAARPGLCATSAVLACAVSAIRHACRFENEPAEAISAKERES